MNNWIPFTSEQEVDTILEKSIIKPQIIFKDSTTCGISAYAKERLRDGNHLLENIADFNYLDLLTYRSVSNYIANKLEVIHQSPQIIILKDKKVIYKDSHHTIHAKKIEEVILKNS